MDVLGVRAASRFPKEGVKPSSLRLIGFIYLSTRPLSFNPLSKKGLDASLKVGGPHGAHGPRERRPERVSGSGRRHRPPPARLVEGVCVSVFRVYENLFQTVT